MRKAPASVEKINGDDLQPTPRNKHEGRAGTGGSPTPRRVLPPAQTALHVNLPRLNCTLDAPLRLNQRQTCYPVCGLHTHVWYALSCQACVCPKLLVSLPSSALASADLS
ncbi:hypothetical protein CGCSCA4_v014892 [Colletotrichum siamense]|uniref:Uncharacterized protein n=1 Tax=Colletotrichum siamense TaxID=690259 RepID=A0A9P5BNR9_COLSI|nr:hypothetical protein CGCSCA5_v006131 [Colletotrichum siamense]KAF4828042.1 hypothetical protein CGCSCA4_v014892 [Colletotrichum siamense]KAF4846137.1 hypothetical protein CGCSCA2_v013242 [Colletotrichum siamense]